MMDERPEPIAPNEFELDPIDQAIEPEIPPAQPDYPWVISTSDNFVAITLGKVVFTHDEAATFANHLLFEVECAQRSAGG